MFDATQEAIRLTLAKVGDLIAQAQRSGEAALQILPQIQTELHSVGKVLDEAQESIADLHHLIEGLDGVPEATKALLKAALVPMDTATRTLWRYSNLAQAYQKGVDVDVSLGVWRIRGTILPHKETNR